MNDPKFVSHANYRPGLELLKENSWAIYWAVFSQIISMMKGSSLAEMLPSGQVATIEPDSCVPS